MAEPSKLKPEQNRQADVESSRSQKDQCKGGSRLRKSWMVNVNDASSTQTIPSCAQLVRGDAKREPLLIS